MRVLELGWEFPPRISGGLGTACEGLVRGLLASDADVLLVLPRAAGGEEACGATVLCASTLEAARQDSGNDAAARADVAATSSAKTSTSIGTARRAHPGKGALDVLGLPTLLRPYASAADYARSVGERQGPLSGGYGRDLASEVARYASVVGEVAARETFDVIHANDWMTFPAGLAAREASGRPLVLHVHASEWDRSGPAGDKGIVEIERRAFAEADGIVCVSHYTKRVLERRYGVSPARMHVVHNAVRRRDAPRPWQGSEAGLPLSAALAAALDAGARRKLGIEPPTVLFLGRLTRQKGPAFFLEAAGLVHAARPDVRFLVAGDGDLKASLVESSAANGLARTVFFTGFLAPEEVEAAYASADLYVMPSVSEPFGIAPLEALSLDVPVIVSRQSGVAETLPSAPKVDYWDVRDLAGKVLALLAQPELRRALVTSGQRDIESLRWETAGARLVEVLRSVVSTQSISRIRGEWWR